MESRVPSARVSNTCMGEGFVADVMIENRYQSPISDKLLQIGTDVVGTHVCCKVLSLCFGRAVFF